MEMSYREVVTIHKCEGHSIPGGMVPVALSKWCSRVLKPLGSQWQPGPNILHTGICISWQCECTRAGRGENGSKWRL